MKQCQISVVGCRGWKFNLAGSGGLPLRVKVCLPVRKARASAISAGIWNMFVARYIRPLYKPDGNSPPVLLEYLIGMQPIYINAHDCRGRRGAVG